MGFSVSYLLYVINDADLNLASLMYREQDLPFSKSLWNELERWKCDPSLFTSFLTIYSYLSCFPNGRISQHPLPSYNCKHHTNYEC